MERVLIYMVIYFVKYLSSTITISQTGLFSLLVVVRPNVTLPQLELTNTSTTSWKSQEY